MAMALAGACVAMAAVAVAPAAAQERYALSGTKVAVYNLAGKARVVRGSGGDVVVSVTRHGDDANRLEVRTDEVRGRMTLRVIYPGDQVVYGEMGRHSSTSVRIRSDGTFGGRIHRGHRIRIRGSGRGVHAWADLVIEVPEGRDLGLHVAAGDVEATDLDGRFLMATGSGTIAATQVTGELRLDTGSGSVTAERIRGSLNVDTGSGGVTTSDVSGPEVRVDTGSGSVRGDGVVADRLRVDTGSGSIRLGAVSVPDIYLDTGSGSVEMELRTDVQRLDVDTGSGSVTIRAPADLGAEVDIETGSGGIDVDFPVQVRSVRRDHMEGVIGDGRGTIRVDTGSGGVRLIRN